MKYREMNKLLLSALFLLIAGFTVSCTDDDESVIGTDDTVPVELTPVTRSYEALDQEIGAFRVMVFNRRTGLIAYTEKVADLSTSTPPLRINMKTGVYDFFFVANEDRATGLTATLEAINMRSQVYGLTLPHTAFDNDARIPMSAILYEVHVLAANKYKIGDSGAELPTPMPVQMVRAGVRLDLSLITADTDIVDAFSQVEISNVPSTIPLLESDAMGAMLYVAPGTMQTRTVAKAQGDNTTSPYFTTITSGANAGKQEWTKERIIVPASVLETPTAANCMKLTVRYGDTATSDTESVVLYDAAKMTNPPLIPYTVPRNMYYKIEAEMGKLNDVGGVHIAASTWTTDDMDGTIPGEYQLNVSHVSAKINGMNGARIYFSSNQSDVRVEENVYVGATGTTTALANEVFNDIAKTSTNPDPTRLHYDPLTGDGYMDIIADQGLNSPGTFTHRIILSAGPGVADDEMRLKREITVTSVIAAARQDFDPWGATKYIGTFHRKTETGERVITGEGTTYSYGKWRVRVETGSDFITLSTTPSFDPNIGTNNPGWAEKFPVKDGTVADEYLYGKGRMYFRVGMKSAYTPTAAAPARYGRISVEFDTGWGYSLHNYIYVRQGEDEDYLFGPSDPVTAGPMAGMPRDAARKFVPYNLTLPQYYLGSALDYIIASGVNGGQFVEYPTQAGAHFQWAKDTRTDLGGMANPSQFINAGWHPTNSFGISSWNFNFIPMTNGWDNYKATQELCPSGYRRPTDGPTDRMIYNKTGDSLRYSEMRVSIFRYPVTGDAHKDVDSYNDTGIEAVTQILNGYYADGYFDRRTLTIPSSNPGAPLSAVSDGTAHVAYMGVLFVNTIDGGQCKSLFFPQGGSRDSDTGSLSNAGGGSGYYWTGSGTLTPGTDPDVKFFGGWVLLASPWGMDRDDGTGTRLPSPAMSGAMPSFGYQIRCVKE